MRRAILGMRMTSLSFRAARGSPLQEPRQLCRHVDHLRPLHPEETAGVDVPGTWRERWSSTRRRLFACLASASRWRHRGGSHRSPQPHKINLPPRCVRTVAVLLPWVGQERAAAMSAIQQKPARHRYVGGRTAAHVCGRNLRQRCSAGFRHQGGPARCAFGTWCSLIDASPTMATRFLRATDRRSWPICLPEGPRRSRCQCQQTSTIAMPRTSICLPAPRHPHAA